MAIVKKEVLENQLANFRRENYPEIQDAVDGAAFSYFVVPQSLNPNLEGFAIAMSLQDPKDGELYAVAETVPESDRAHYMRHEYREQRQPADDFKRCVHTLQRELAEIPAEMRDAYLARRTAFFDRLINFAAAFSDCFSAETVSAFKKSHAYLLDLADS